MAIPGRKPKPEFLRNIDNGAGQRGEFFSPALGIVAGLPEPPDDLGEDARDIWWSTGAELLKAGLMAPLYKDTFRLYCVALGNVIKLDRAIGDITQLFTLSEKTKYPMLNPLLYERRQQFADSVRLATEFGMTPSSLGRVTRAPDSQLDLPGLGGEADPMDTLLQSPLPK